MLFVDLVKHVQCFSYGGPDSIASIDELSIAADVIIHVTEQLVGNLNRYLRHI